MNPALIYPFIIVAGALQAAGAVMNAQLRLSLANPWLASFVSFVLIAFFFASMFAIIPRPLPPAQSLEAMPWWAPLGGLAGAVAVFAGLTLIDKLGAGTVNGLIIAANIVTSIAIDHFGLLNTPVHEASPLRLVGGALMVGGIVLISRF
jgi:bacterial/archaeal transporter family-2 protein